MHSYSVHDIILYLILPAILLVAFIFLLFDTDNKINQNNIEYIESLGIQVSDKISEISYITIPETAVGELLQYRGRRAIRYSYTILNPDNSRTEFSQIHLIVYKRKIISVDMST